MIQSIVYILPLNRNFKNFTFYTRNKNFTSQVVRLAALLTNWVQVSGSLQKIDILNSPIWMTKNKNNDLNVTFLLYFKYRNDLHKVL